MTPYFTHWENGAQSQGRNTIHPHRGPGRSQQEQGGDRQDGRNQSGPLLGSFCMSGTVLGVLFMYLTEIMIPSPCPHHFTDEENEPQKS